MKSFLNLACLLLVFQVFSQNKTIAAGEKLIFGASYKMSGLLTEIAQVTMETSEIKTSSATLLRLKCNARTYSKWDSFFKIDDLYESYVNPSTLKPYLYKREINEGGYYKFMQYNFNRKSGLVKSKQRKRSKKKGGFWEKNQTLKLNGSTLDIVSMIYHIRNLDIHKATVGKSDTFTIVFDNVEHRFSLTLLGKEMISSAVGNKECYKLAVTINNNDLLKGKNENLIWLTADNNKVPVLAKFKVAIGSGELKIKSATGLKY